ncbi:hypothetical protein GTP44_11985 [Duganella sp. FT50W]|uniref:Uncharacterized protein n=1 Tax=Duganella lactea TaxID=2692173 RepID=A0A6L8MJE8_9BURK|nr:hypothetical protein [Duganella lactea]MYM82674.1 hypothetical protein [Duganella lactea]
MMLVAALLFAATTQAASEPPPKPADELLAPVLTDEVIRKAVRETIAEDPRPAPVKNPDAGTIRADAISNRMNAAFEQARVPDCLHEDALKLQPAQIGPIAVVGPYSLPWIIAAVARGKCR